jgi:hypothetical protein
MENWSRFDARYTKQSAAVQGLDEQRPRTARSDEKGELMRTNGSFPALIFIVIAGMGAVLGFSLHTAGHAFLGFTVFGIALFVAAVTSSAIRVADQWSKAVVLRLGKFRALGAC